MKLILFKYFDLWYAVKFMGMLLLFYSLNIVFIGVTTEGGIVYSLFLDRYLNYIEWLTGSILFVSKYIVNLLGYECYIGNGNIIRIINGPGVQVWMPCLGLGVIGFWIIFIFRHTAKLKTKIYWSFIGIVVIWFINCLRISVLLIALEKSWEVNKYIDHHDLFNIVSYSIIIFLIFVFNKKTKSRGFILS